jgi:NADH:ubiquinone oxidoreductase subunit F (NADH-binding)
MTGPAGWPALITGSLMMPRLLPADLPSGPVPLPVHLSRYGPPPAFPGRASRDAMIAEVARAGLTGRGGAGFPAARKLAAVSGRRAPVVIANGTEGEPAVAKDKMLMARSPHLVLDGAVIAAELIGAARVVVLVHRHAREFIDRAVAERRRARPDPVPVSVRTAAGRFTAGESSAAVHWVDRGIPTPLTGPPVREQGVHRAPTLVHNVETLAHLALIARYGAAWFRSAGTPDEPGSMLVTVIGAVRLPGVAEIAVGTPVNRLIDRCGGLSGEPQALLLGGYSGSWVSAAAAIHRPFSAAGLADLGAVPGAGLIAVLPSTGCGLRETARVSSYLAGETAGQCGPCVFGLAAIASETGHLAEAGRGGDVGLLDRWLGQVGDRGGCGHPAGVTRLVRSALRVFASELDLHEVGQCRGSGGVLPVPPGRHR